MTLKRILIALVLLALLGVGAAYGWRTMQGNRLPAGFASGNGRIEATEIDISALTGGRIASIRPAEGDFVKAGDVLVQMDIVQLNAQMRQAEAQLRQTGAYL